MLTKSKLIYEEAMNFVPAGVQSNFRYFEPHPIYFSRGKGSRIWDVDGNEYVDCVINYGALILGHAHPKVTKAVKDQLEVGLTAGVETELSVEVSKKVKQIVPSAEMVRFSNTGTEAVMHAILIARGYTGKDKIVKVEGGYHGWHDPIAISEHPPIEKAGPETAPIPVPAFGGLPKDVTRNTLVIPFNDEHVAEKVIWDNKEDVAALIVEPVGFNMGCVLPKNGYLKAIREITQENDVPLIFDEVITGFRLAPGGAQEYYGVTPDMSVFAKAIANGFQLSAVVGRKDLMSLSAPKIGKVGYAGTYNGHQISLAASSATLDELKDGRVQKHLNEFVTRLIKGFSETVEDLKVKARMQGVGGKFQIYFTDREVTDYRTACTANEQAFMSLQKELLARGCYLVPSRFMHHGVTAAHSDEDLQRILGAIEGSLSELKRVSSELVEAKA